MLPLHQPGSSSPSRIRTLNFGTKIRGLAIRRTGRGIGGICTLVHAFAEHCLATRPRHHASGRPGSNRRHLTWKDSALPTELRPRVVHSITQDVKLCQAEDLGFEPSAPVIQVQVLSRDHWHACPIFRVCDGTRTRIFLGHIEGYYSWLYYAHSRPTRLCSSFSDVSDRRSN